MFKKLRLAAVLFMATFANIALANTPVVDPISNSQSINESVNINTADANTIAEVLSGIGPKKAQAIIDYRQLHGPFTSKQDLTEVKGIGDKLLAQNQDRINL